jgi:DNA-binding MarR family transcriptional regulator
MTRDEHYSVLFDLFLADAAASTLLGPAMRGSGLNPSQHAEYSLLRQEGPLTVTEFATRSNRPLSTASDTLRAMEARGHVVRSRHPDDGRAWALRLTPAGRAAHSRAQRRFRVAAAQVSSRLGRREDDVRDALALLSAACVDALDDLHRERRRAVAQSDRHAAG